MKKFFFISLGLCLVFRLLGQQSLQVGFRFEPKNEALEKRWKGYQRVDSASVAAFEQSVLMDCYERSYLLAGISQRQHSADTLILEIKTGNPYLLKQFHTGNIPSEWLDASGFRFPSAKEKAFELPQLLKGMKLILSYAENNGYPFATLYMDSVLADSDGLCVGLRLEKNALTFFDSIGFGGDARISNTFLQNYSNIKPGMVYQESLLKDLDARLSELPYVQVARPLGVYYYGNKAKPYVYLNNRKASSFDGVIGFAPNSSLNNKLVLTGDLNLKLVNLMGTGKSLELAYRGYLNNSQDLQIRFIWPYFLNSKLGIDYSFKLNKFDTSWLELYNDLGLQYRFTANNFVKVFYQRRNIQVLNADTQYVKNFETLPPVQDVRSDLYGIAIRKSTLNYFFNPSKGFLLELEGGAGTRKIVQNASIAQIELGSGSQTYHVYDSVQMNSLQYKALGNLSVYSKLAGHWVLCSQLKGGILANQNLFVNELFRIGGLKTLKGFDEQSIFASGYLIVNEEIRYLFQQNSSFVVFWNGAYYRNDAPQFNLSDKPWGVGAGMNLETGAGIFSLYYAIGAQKGNPLEFRSAKIHFGLVNFF